MAVVRLFASAREAAGLTSDEIDGATVGDVLDEACRRYGERFRAVLATSKVWVNGEPGIPATPVVASDVVAVLPPVSGGAVVPTLVRAEPAGGSGAEPPRRPGVASPRRPGTEPSRRADEGPVRRPGPRPPIVRGNLALVPEPDPAPESDPDTRIEPEATPSSRARADRPPLAVVHQSVRPHGRLGLAWAAVTAGVTLAGTPWLGAWMALLALVAATQTVGAWRKRGERPQPLLAAGLAAGLPVAASFGAASFNVRAINGVLVAGVLITLVARLFTPTRAPSRDVALTLLVGIPIGLAAASPVLLRHGGLVPALLLLSFAALYDTGAYLIGTGAASAWEGPAAGVAAFVPLTILAAVVFVPPFSGAEPLVLGLLAAVLTPIGPVVGSALLGDGTTDAPALRRLDSLLVLGPIWTWCALAFLR